MNSFVHMTLLQIDACPKECVLFRGEYADDAVCKLCGECRYEEDTPAHKRAQQLLTGVALDDDNVTIAEKKLKYTARHVYRYCPIIPVLSTRCTSSHV